MEALFSHWSAVRINCLGEITENLRALVPRLEDRPDLFIQQALKTHSLINTAAALSLQRGSVVQSHGQTSWPPKPDQDVDGECIWDVSLYH